MRTLKDLEKLVNDQSVTDRKHFLLCVELEIGKYYRLIKQYGEDYRTEENAGPIIIASRNHELFRRFNEGENLRDLATEYELKFSEAFDILSWRESPPLPNFAYEFRKVFGASPVIDVVK